MTDIRVAAEQARVAIKMLIRYRLTGDAHLAGLAALASLEAALAALPGDKGPSLSHSAATPTEPSSQIAGRDGASAWESIALEGGGVVTRPIANPLAHLAAPSGDVPSASPCSSLSESDQSALPRTLYSVTGDIKDINTVLVPREATVAMHNAAALSGLCGKAPWIEDGRICHQLADASAVYKAMLAAAPDIRSAASADGKLSVTDCSFTNDPPTARWWRIETPKEQK